MNARVTSVTEYSLISAIQHVSGGHNVMNVGGCSVNAVNQQDRGIIATHVHPHGKVPHVVF